MATISTHILTKRMTLFLFRVWVVWVNFNSHPHEEDDLKVAKHTRNSVYFNSHPHEEDDSTAWKNPLAMYISTHILTKRMTCFSM